MKKIINIYRKYEEIINYIIIGGLTTLISLSSYYLCVLTFLNSQNALQLQIANIISWILSVTFAYFTNRVFVFKSKETNKIKECSKFFLSRISTLIIDMLTMFVLVTLFKINDAIAKIFVQFIVLILNYIFSKFLIFNKKLNDNKKVLFIASTGGHLSELLQLKPLFKKYNTYLITEKTKSTKNLKKKFSNVNYLVYGTKDHKISYIFKFLYNCFKSLILYIKIRPKVIVTTGTHTAVPICYIGKIFGSKIIFIETFANSKTKTLSGRLIYPIANIFIVQWESMLELYPKAIYGGWIY